MPPLLTCLLRCDRVIFAVCAHMPFVPATLQLGDLLEPSLSVLFGEFRVDAGNFAIEFTGVSGTDISLDHE